MDQTHTSAIEEDIALVQSYIPLVEFLGLALGSSTEVVLHDVAHPDQSVIAIANGHVSGRSIGSPSTDLMYKVLRDGIRDGKDYVIGYEAHSVLHNIPLVSSTFFIRREGRIVGALCLNTDPSAFVTVKESIERLGALYFPNSHTASASTEHTGVQEENLVASVSDMAADTITAMCVRRGISAHKLSVDDRLSIIRTLNERGYFRFKGAIGTVADQLGVAESSVYRYLHTIQKNK